MCILHIYDMCFQVGNKCTLKCVYSLLKCKTPKCGEHCVKTYDNHIIVLPSLHYKAV